MGCSNSTLEPLDGLRSEQDPEVRSFEERIEATVQSYEQELAPLREQMQKLTESYKQNLADATTDKRLTRNQAALNSSRHGVNSMRTAMEDARRRYDSISRDVTGLLREPVCTVR